MWHRFGGKRRVMLRFDGKVALVTGGGRGVGRAHAELLAARGCKVLINDAGVQPTGDTAQDDPANEAAEAIRAAGGEALAHRGNVLEDHREMVARAVEEWGRLDIVICNAGTSRGGLFGDMSGADWHDAFDVHLKGTAEVVRAAWPHLVDSGAGRVLTTASTGMFGNQRATNYGAAKAAIFGFTKSLSLESAAHNVNVNCILPSAWTRLTSRITDPVAAQVLESRFGPEEIATLAAWLVHPETRVNGEGFMVGGGMAQRVVFAVAQPVVLKTPSPEDWADQREALLSGPVSPMPTMVDAFADQILAIAPELAEPVATMRSGGVNADAKVTGSEASS